MSSSYAWKLRALLKKNLILMKRNFISTLFEIFFPSIIIVVILILRKAFSVDTHDFSEEGSIESFIKDKSMTSINYNLYSNLEDQEWNGLSLLSPFQICSSSNEQFEERKIIASLGIPGDIKQQMINDAELFKTKGINDFTLTMDSFQEFSSVEELNEYIKDPSYLSKKDKLICFGVKFSYDEENEHYNYSLHFFDYPKQGNEGIQDIANNAQGMFDPFQTGPDLNSFMRYKNGAYSYMMKIINQYILRKETGKSDAELNYGIAAMKYIDYRSDSFGEFMGYMIGVILVMAYMSPLSLYVYRMVGDKESKIKESMKIMGLEESQYFLSYFIQYTVINIFSSIINAGLFTVFLDRISYYHLFVTLLLWSLNVFALIYFFQSFIDKTKIALVLSLVIYFMMYCVSLACMFEGGSLAAKIGLSLFPQVCLNNGILLFSKFQYHFRTFKDREFFEIYTTFSVGLMYIMFVVDFFLFLFLGFYLNNVLPHDFGIRKPLYFIFTSDFWCSNKKRNNDEKKLIDKKLEENAEEDNKENNYVVYGSKDDIIKDEVDEKLYGDSPNFESEEIYKNRNKNDDKLKIRNIVKMFGDGKIAVNGVNLNFYKDEIFALLGHNGAGKTTLISMLTGMYEATQGTAIYEGVNILDSMNMEIFREKLGICPQHDILFEDLTIREHLEMFSIFKGVESTEVDNEVNKTLHDFQLEDIQYMLAKNLSAGQRRKLSISISLIGGSKVIFLDEPSSGMDITSRRNLWEILKRQTDGKIIILTTHYMEEASVLGKRIGIINAGKMKCIGSPLFLIEKYGKFMSLNVTKEEDCDSNTIIEFIKNNAEDIEYEALSEEIMFRIPIKNENSGKKTNFDLKSFFTKFDDNVKKLRIKSYSVSMPTLEDVFLNVAAEDNNNIKSKEELEQQQENDKILYNSNLREDYTKNSKFLNDFKISMKRRYLITIRDIKGFLMEILCPIILTLFGLLLSKIEIGYKSGPVEVSFEELGKQNIIYSSYDDTNINLNDFILEDIPSTKIEGLTIDNFPDKKDAVKEYINKIYEIQKDTEDSSKKEVDMASDDYTGYFGSLFMLDVDNSNKKYEFIIALNARVRQGLPIYSHYFLKHILEKACGKKLSITFTHYPLPMTHDLSESKSFGNKIAIVLFLAIALALIPANFITIFVKERANNSKHLMRISGINITSYWIVNYIFELVKYYFTGGVCLLLLYLFDAYKDYLYISYITLGPSLVSSTYCLSFFFNNESDAQNIVILINFLFGYLGSIIVNVLRGIESAKLVAKIIEYIFGVVPIFCFDFAFILLTNPMGIYLVDYPNEFYKFKGDEMIKKFNLMLAMVIYSSAECVLYTLLHIYIESQVYSFKKSTDNKLENDINDSEVIKEINKVNNIEIISSSENDLIKIDGRTTIDDTKDLKEELYAVKVKNLRKIYTNGCCSKQESDIIAIKNLNFAIMPGECFGLLGLNGAGKTTTFKCITQELSQDNGKIYVNNMDISGHFNELNELFGYCPQFDAIFELLSVYENLEFYASIKGIKKSSIQSLVNAMIKEMALDEFTNKIAGRLSGGNKRKLAVAISMLCNPPIILLDEPSTGMDPEARRFMWSVIHKMSTKGRKSSVIMTTHSMDEAETLCKRMAIMVNGEFVCMGKANQIKDKYGYGYEADVRIKPMNESQKKEIYDKFNIDKNLLVSFENINSILDKMGKNNFSDELKEGRLGERIKREIELNGNVHISSLLNWIFFVENALKFIIKGKNYFDEIIVSEHIENNFLFKMKKEHSNKSIGFFFGLFEEGKESCFVTEYSIQKTSLEQIFNKFAASQGKTKEQMEENNDNDNNIVTESKNIVVDDDLVKKLLK
jgi:ATP-binding cassette subfamily A (ABC1) protein 3